MRDVVEKVLGAEREAREKLDQARASAAAVKAEADRAAESIVREARERAALILKERLDAARAGSAASLIKGQKLADEEAASWYAAREPELDTLAARVLDAVLAPDLGER